MSSGAGWAGASGMDDQPSSASAGAHARDHFVVEQARPDDVEAVVSLVRELAALEGHISSFTATPERLTDGLFGSVPGLLCWVTRSDRRVVGAALCATTWGGVTCRPSIRLLDLVVDAEMRSRGVGTRLMAAVATACVDLDCNLDWMVRTENYAAQAFYARLGARPRLGWQPWQLTVAAVRDLVLAAECGESGTRRADEHR